MSVEHYMTLFEQLEKTILEVVNSSTGIKGVELVLKVMANTMPKEYESKEFFAILQSLVDRDEILELEYTVPQYPEKCKSIYFPKGTVINLINPYIKIGGTE